MKTGCRGNAPVCAQSNCDGARGENKGFFGYDEMVPDPPLTFDSVTVHSSVSLAGAAKAIGATSEDVQRLNPHLRRGRTPPLGPGKPGNCACRRVLRRSLWPLTTIAAKTESRTSCGLASGSKTSPAFEPSLRAGCAA